MKAGTLDLGLLINRMYQIRDDVVQEKYTHGELHQHDMYIERVSAWVRALVRIEDPGACMYEAQELIKVIDQARHVVSNEIYHNQMIHSANIGGKL